MSKYTDWGMIHGEGEIVCECDNCDYEERIIWYNRKANGSRLYTRRYGHLD